MFHKMITQNTTCSCRDCYVRVAWIPVWLAAALKVVVDFIKKKTNE